MKLRHDRNGTIATGLLEPRQVIHEVTIALVHRIFLLIQPVVQVVPSAILVLDVSGVDVIDNDNLCLSEHFLPCRDIEGAVDDLAEHVHPHILEARIESPVTVCVAVNPCVVEILDIFRPDELRPIPDSTTVDAALLHDRGESGRHRIFLPIVFAKHHLESSIPSTVVVTYAIVVGQTGDIGSPCDTLGIVEARCRRVFIEP